MGKKKAFTKGAKETNVQKNVFNVNKIAHKKKAKAVKINVKKVYSMLISVLTKTTIKQQSNATININIL